MHVAGDVGFRDAFAIVVLCPSLEKEGSFECHWMGIVHM